MTWTETNAENERKKLVREWLRRRHTVLELAHAFNVSERVAHKAIRRFKEEGWAGLADRSRARLSQACTPLDVVAQVVAAREAHPTWGPRKLRAFLLREHVDTPWPAPSTIGSILMRHGLVAHRQRRRGRSMPTAPCVEAVTPNDSWSMDYKGQFKTGDGRWCYPFTVTDNASRFILKCKALRAPTLPETWSEIAACFRDNGLPKALRSDNGTPFAGSGLTRLSTISVRLIRLGVLPDFIAPGKPQQNGRHERMHRTLKQSTAAPPAGNLGAQQRRFNAFLDEFNHTRPHEALGNQVPSDVHTPSLRSMPPRLPVVGYDDGEITRAINGTGHFKWDGEIIFVSETLCGERVAFDPIDDALHIVRFAEHPIAIFDEITKKLHPVGHRDRRRDGAKG